MSMTRQEQLDAVVRNYGVWKGKGDHIAFESGNSVVYLNSPSEIPVSRDGRLYGYTRAEVEQRKAELQKKPSWGDIRFSDAEYMAQDANGQWVLYSGKPVANGNHGLFVHSNTNKDVSIHAGKGEVIGDWRDTLEKRPAADDQSTPEEEEAFKMLEARNGGLLTDEGTKAGKSNSELYPQYFKDVSGVDEIDVYAVHQLFEVDDPSGAIQHASKKLLLSGVRTGGKSKYKDIKEARDTLNRWLELNNV